MKVKITNVKKALSFITLLMLVFLEYMYMQNALNSQQYSTYGLQITIVFCAIIQIISTLVEKNGKIDVVFILAFLLCISMMSTSIYKTDRTGNNLYSLIVKLSLWLLVFFSGFVAASSFESKHLVAGVVTGFCVIASMAFLKSIYWDFSVKNKNYVLTSVYYLLCCLPYVLSLQNKKIQTLLFAYVGLLTVFSFKRSALLVFVAIIIMLFFANRKELMETRKKLVKFLSVLGAFLLVVIIFLLFFGDEETLGILGIEYWIVRFSRSSSRMSILQYVLDLQFRSNFSEWIVGHGYNAVLSDTFFNLSAHNDYIEILYDYGLIGFACFLLYIACLFKRKKSVKVYTNAHYNGYVCCLTIFLIASIPSHMLTYSTYFLLLSYYFGYSIGRSQLMHDKGDFDETRYLNFS